MKSFVAVLAALATVSAAEKCDYSVVGPKFYPLGPSIATCFEKTGYSLARPKVMPTPEQAKAICTQCTDFITAVTTTEWANCEMEMAGKNQTITSYFNSITEPCGKPMVSKPKEVKIVSTKGAGEKCIYGEVAPQLHTLGAELTSCIANTGFNPADAKTMPTPELSAKICTGCKDFVDKVAPMTWPDCYLTLGGKNQSLTTYFNALTQPCGKTAGVPQPAAVAAPAAPAAASSSGVVAAVSGAAVVASSVAVLYL
ncbi:hypothetical protein P43SY_011323 [Pythium insidiosum]|uniref:Elicitin-like protein n=1 Tax=Pythium insidiosum TaxID=114742 RepID=A0AAD5LSY7_PYTIN|nr:hypothetical protein P43SY_011323 [Pythium insidiosum]KAJ0411201.1 hypothetical protein ATCC90586_003840 [Pythium insidiosum]